MNEMLSHNNIDKLAKLRNFHLNNFKFNISCDYL